jgi:hypothetical protein
MEPLRQGSSLSGIQEYVAKMEAERGLDRQDLPSQCSISGKRSANCTGPSASSRDTLRIRKAGLPMSAMKPLTLSSCSCP